MSIFTCCEREDETKYFHTCGCPSATFSCESEQIQPELVGWSEYSGFASLPPLKYLKKSLGGSESFSTSSGGCFIGDEYQEVTVTASGSGGATLDPVTGLYSVTATHSHGSSYPSCNSGGSPSLSCPFPNQNFYWPNAVRIVSATTCSANLLTSSSGGVNVSSTLRIKTTLSGSYSHTLSDEDTASDAIAREIPVIGTSCSSLWETRSTGFSWVKRTSGYTIECENLIAGLEYEVKPVIRKRTAVIGSFGEWEDVTVTPVTFTATGTTETIDQSGEPIPLDHIQGYEYEITAVSIEKTA